MAKEAVTIASPLLTKKTLKEAREPRFAAPAVSDPPPADCVPPGGCRIPAKQQVMIKAAITTVVLYELLQ